MKTPGFREDGLSNWPCSRCSEGSHLDGRGKALELTLFPTGILSTILGEEDGDRRERCDDGS